MGPGEAPAQPCPSHVVPVSTGQAAWGGAGRMALIKIWLGQTRPFLCWDEREEIRRLSERGGHKEEVREGDEMGRLQVRWRRLGQRRSRGWVTRGR